MLKKGTTFLTVQYDNGEQEKVDPDNIFPIEVPIEFGKETVPLAVCGPAAHPQAAARLGHFALPACAALIYDTVLKHDQLDEALLPDCRMTVLLLMLKGTFPHSTDQCVLPPLCRWASLLRCPTTARQIPVPGWGKLPPSARSAWWVVTQLTNSSVAQRVLTGHTQRAW